MDIVKKEKIFYEKLKDPEFVAFYTADTDRKPDEMLSYDDWKVVAMNIYPELTEEELKGFFIEGSGVRAIKTKDE